MLQGSGTDPVVTAEVRAAVVAGASICRDVLNYRKDGTSFWNRVTIDPIRDSKGQLTGFIGVMQQTGSRHLASPSLAAPSMAELDAKLDSIAGYIPGYIYRRVMRTDGSIEMEYCSPSLGTMLGMDAKEAARSVYDHVHPDDRDLLMTAIRNSAIRLSIFREEFRLVSATGDVHWMRSDAPPRRMKNGETVWDGMAIEISAEKRWQTEISNLALHDSLTGLLTREAWRQAITLQLAASASDAPHCGLLYIDIVAFRDLNHKLGQRAGDDILCEVARRLAVIAASAGGVVARLGGDEFALLVPACAGNDGLLVVANMAGDALARPMQINARTLAIQTCIGASLSGERAEGEATYTDVETEFRAQAEIALRQAKQAGYGGVVLYSAAHDDRFHAQTILAASLEHAIANDQLELHYQPLVDLASGRIVSAEALVRWNHPELGMQWPDLFIPLAEKSGLIVQLGRWVFQQSLRQRKVWQDAGLALSSLAINVSVNQLREPGFIAFVATALREVGGNAKDFEIELTEGLLIEPTPQILASLHALRTMGFTVTIDDFGSGHATFRYVRDFPVDKLKIDQIFVRQLVMGSTDALIIRARHIAGARLGHPHGRRRHRNRDAARFSADRGMPDRARLFLQHASRGGGFCLAAGERDPPPAPRAS